jgi:predicted RNA binding protein with dsRBD fold (UPF0201 family)
VLLSTEENWDVNTIIDVLSTTKDNLRRWIHTKEDFKDFLAGLFMQKHLSRIARKEHLDQSPSFHKNVDYAFDSYLLNTLEEKLKQQISISEDSLRLFYKHNRNRFRTQPEIRLSAILVDNNSIADTIRKSLEGGGQFTKVAEKFSIQTHTAVLGGDLGFYTMEELGDLKTKLFSLRIEEWIGPIIEDGKYLFVKCTDKKESIDKSFEESSKEIKDMLAGMAWLSYRNECVESFKKNIKCNIYTEKLKVVNLN